MIGLIAAALWMAALEPLPTQPILRIDTGRHTAFVHGVVVDEKTRRVLTASEDKTVRVWRLDDGRLLDTFRVPSGLRAEGQLYALALSPKQRILAVAGWTCWDTEARGCVYLLNPDTGEPLGRITGLDEVIATLRFSPDGTHLAVGLMGSQGLRVIRLQDRVIVAADRAYRDKLLELDFCANGRLVTTGLDGFVRLYDEHFVLAGRADASLAGKRPFGVRCSPDGQRLAVGFHDAARVSVLDAATLKSVMTLQAPTPGAPRNLTRVAWSADGSMIHATGEPAAASQGSSFYRWRLSAPSKPDILPATAGRVGDMVVTREGAVIFGADDPALGLIDATGRRRYLLGSGVPDYRDVARSLRVSQDGSVVELQVSPGATGARRFSVIRQTLERSSAKPSTPAVPGWRIDPLPLEPYETVHARSLAANGNTMLVGTEWALRAFNKTGGERWSVRTPTLVRAVDSSADGRFAIAVLGDGTVRWYLLRDGTPVLSLFIHADGEGWVAWTPAGDYASSSYGDLLVGWHINRGPERSPDFFRAVQFERELYRPDKVAASLISPAVAATRENHLLAIAPPRISLMPLDAHRIRVTAESSGLSMRDIAVYVNDIPVTSARDRPLRSSEATRFTRDVEIPLDSADNDVRVEVFNGRSMGIGRRQIAGVPRAKLTGDLYVLAIGANQFPELDPAQYLSYAARDAEEIAIAFRAVGSSRFRQVHLQTLTDFGKLPTRAAVLDALRMLSQPTGADTVVVFLASHGISDAAGNYYFVPRDVKRVDLDALLDGKNLPPESSLLGWQPFFDALRSTAGRRLLIVDTCQARNISGRYTDHSLVKRSASSHIAFILASQGNEASQEYAPSRHGLFTFALLEGLRGNGRTTVAEWFGFAAGLVDRLRDRSIGPQTPQLIAPPALLSLPITQTDAPRLPLR